MKIIKTVQNEDLANAVGSGTLPVLATPRLVSWMEEACWKSLQLESGQSSVGYFFEIAHLKPSITGSVVEIVSKLEERRHNKAFFSIEAHCNGQLVASASHKRAIVSIEAFMKGAIGQ